MLKKVGGFVDENRFWEGEVKVRGEELSQNRANVNYFSFLHV